jgi:hypothetical protein
VTWKPLGHEVRTSYSCQWTNESVAGGTGTLVGFRKQAICGCWAPKCEYESDTKRTRDWYPARGSYSQSPCGRIGYGLGDWCSISGRGRSFAVSRPALGPIQPPIQWVLGALSAVLSGWGIKLTIQLYLVPRLRVCGAIPPLFLYVFMAWFLIKK